MSLASSKSLSTRFSSLPPTSPSPILSSLLTPPPPFPFPQHQKFFDDFRVANKQTTAIIQGIQPKVDIQAFIERVVHMRDIQHPEPDAEFEVFWGEGKGGKGRDVVFKKKVGVYYYFLFKIYFSRNGILLER